MFRAASKSTASQTMSRPIQPRKRTPRSTLTRAKVSLPTTLIWAALYSSMMTTSHLETNSRIIVYLSIATKQTNQ